MATLIRSSSSLGRRLRLLFAGVVAAAISALLIANDFVEGLITGIIALLPAILAFVMLVAAFKRADTGYCTCPHCGALMNGLDLSSNAEVLCQACHHYFEGTGRVLREIDPERIAGRPLFRSPLPENPGFPNICCVCGAEARRSDEILLTGVETESWQSASGGAGEAHSWKATSVRVPYCESHSDGAVLGLDSKIGPYIRFKSYPYLRAFCELNGTHPQ